MICILYVFVNSKYYILVVPNWHLKMIFYVVAICDRLVCTFDIAICEVIHLTQNKKPIPFENRLQFQTQNSYQNFIPHRNLPHYTRKATC
jgi:hypothetical protein